MANPETLIRIAREHNVEDARMIGGKLRLGILASLDNGKSVCTMLVMVEPRFDTLALALGY